MDHREEWATRSSGPQGSVCPGSSGPLGAVGHGALGHSQHAKAREYNILQCSSTIVLFTLSYRVCLDLYVI